MQAKTSTITPTENPPVSKGRPFALDRLFLRQTTLKGIGPKLEKLFEKLTGGNRVIDLLFHKPVDLINRIEVACIAQAEPGQTILIKLKTVKHAPSVRPNLPYRIRMSDGTGQLDLVFFQVRGDYLSNLFKIDEVVSISGKLELFQGQPQIVHPEILSGEKISCTEAVYPLTAGVTNKIITKAVTQALETMPDLPEWQDQAFLAQSNFEDFKSSIIKIHKPVHIHDLLPGALQRQRLAYDELLSGQLALALIRNHQRARKGRALKINASVREKFFANLPFSLTQAQQKSLHDIDADMSKEDAMLRLLQGDVGSGKTVIAALAMLNAATNGLQAALMAPTEILARQHAQTLTPWFEKLGFQTVTLTGRDKGKQRDNLIHKISEGSAHIVIGTHSLFQDAISFYNLGVAVIDEQHRFGVHQRLMLSRKGPHIDTLVMTATPIPRTLAMTLYGDMDVSRLDQKPPGRKPIETRLVARDNLNELVEGLKRQVANKARIYWVCPLVEESEFTDLQAAEDRYQALQAHFGARVGLMHGRMKPAEKDEAMNRFKAGDFDILVSTTVIEVGVDVPEATIMVIEHAERFGLSQLHQLRGRVGRGASQSYCFLAYNHPLGVIAKERLRIMRETEDGFLIAEKDLQLRGLGEILGTRQSGIPDFKFADLSAHGDLLKTAHDDAKLILHKDPGLNSARGKALRHLLYLFEKDQAVSYLRSG